MEVPEPGSGGATYTDNFMKAITGVGAMFWHYVPSLRLGPPYADFTVL
jgi:hypothetical protein